MGNHPGQTTFITKEESSFCNGIYFITKITPARYFNDTINLEIPQFLELIFGALGKFQKDYSIFCLLKTLLQIFPERLSMYYIS